MHTLPCSNFPYRYIQLRCHHSLKAKWREHISVDMCHAIFIKLDEADWQADTTDERLKHKAVFAKAMSIINVK